jgi:hypothetical protein
MSRNIFGKSRGHHRSFKSSQGIPDLIGLTVVNTVDEFSIDGTLSGNSDSALPTEKAVKTYVDSTVSTNDEWLRNLTGNIDGGPLVIVKNSSDFVASNTFQSEDGLSDITLISIKITRTLDTYQDLLLRTILTQR